MQTCQIHEYNYKYLGQYTSQQCSDPKELYLSILRSPSDLVVWSSGNFDPISVNGLANCLHMDLSSISGLDFSMYLGYWTDVYVYQKGNFLETYQRGVIKHDFHDFYDFHNFIK